jgi:hypothetical protein
MPTAAAKLDAFISNQSNEMQSEEANKAEIQTYYDF